MFKMEKCLNSKKEGIGKGGQVIGIWIEESLIFVRSSRMRGPRC